MTKLSNSQSEALIKLRDNGPRPAYPGLNLGTLKSLSSRHLVSADHQPGSGWFPQNNIIWSITDAGRAALASKKETADE